MLRKDVELAAKDLEEHDNGKRPAHRSRSGERPAVVPPSEPSQADHSAGVTERPSPSWRPFSSLPPAAPGHAPQVTYPPERRDTWVDSPLDSSGFYSRTDEQVESVPLPRPPRVPRLSERDAPESPVPDVPPSFQSGTSRARRESRPRVFIPARLRRRADEWLATGSLNLPAAWSARHARAMQRGLLLALLMEPGWAALPEGMQQRAGWLLREGWAEGTGVRDADDVITLLQLPPTSDARDLLVRAVESVFPDAVRWSAPASCRSPSTRPPSTNPPSKSAPPTRPASYRWSWIPSDE